MPRGRPRRQVMEGGMNVMDGARVDPAPAPGGPVPPPVPVDIPVVAIRNMNSMPVWSEGGEESMRTYLERLERWLTMMRVPAKAKVEFSLQRQPSNMRQVILNNPQRPARPVNRDAELPELGRAAETDEQYWDRIKEAWMDLYSASGTQQFANLSVAHDFRKQPGQNIDEYTELFEALWNSACIDEEMTNAVERMKIVMYINNLEPVIRDEYTKLALHSEPDSWPACVQAVRAFYNLHAFQQLSGPRRGLSGVGSLVGGALRSYVSTLHVGNRYGATPHFDTQPAVMTLSASSVTPLTAAVPVENSPPPKRKKEHKRKKRVKEDESDSSSDGSDDSDSSDSDSAASHKKSKKKKKKTKDRDDCSGINQLNSTFQMLAARIMQLIEYRKNKEPRDNNRNRNFDDNSVDGQSSFDNAQRPRSKADIQCYKCGKIGHYANTCPNSSPTNLQTSNSVSVPKG